MKTSDIYKKLSEEFNKRGLPSRDWELLAKLYNKAQAVTPILEELRRVKNSLETSLKFMSACNYPAFPAHEPEKQMFDDIYQNHLNVISLIKELEND
jgi:hypothetical protein